MNKEEELTELIIKKLTEMNEEFKDFANDVDKSFSKIQNRFDLLDERFDSLEVKLTKPTENITVSNKNFNDEYDSLERRITKVEEKIREIKKSRK
ncbi:hypothetical protein [Ureibacillus aquaedulcis]|uniref:t-SNARE coiled-coil homology domain-containing protein n=1 Tax=Ureibacillus aquaedulcis TaxID=3058421 RepID=A0ABT8GPL7_9BACL|nr:hypothetical protein [Ureibacillus sp. BA0131]MDN4493358.1 hypothetical protein [Ureibacillus sp. BA0131]